MMTESVEMKFVVLVVEKRDCTSSTEFYTVFLVFQSLIIYDIEIYDQCIYMIIVMYSGLRVRALLCSLDTLSDEDRTRYLVQFILGSTEVDTWLLLLTF